ncbi:MAG: nucleoside-diphosphate kinase [Bacteroidaceae bacterium]|nr:nucleoside-diphosphate kinase [Bacteroidaceae bacterium]
MERTLVLLKPSVIKRGLIGEIITRFERKGLRIIAMKMLWMNDQLVEEHYSHLKDKPFCPNLKASMQATPIVAMVIEGLEVVRVVRAMAGVTNGRNAAIGTIRGDYSMSNQQNIVHASDGVYAAVEEIARFFKPEEVYEFGDLNFNALYAVDEVEA